MQRRKKGEKGLATAMILGCLFLFGCPDDNEPDVPDGKDFKEGVVTIDGSNVVTDIEFYAPYSMSTFYYYFDTDDDQAAEYLVRCYATSFAVYGESAPGLHNILKYSGSATLTDNNTKYHIEFPFSALDQPADEEWVIYYWFFGIDGGDRMPDEDGWPLPHIL